MTTVSVCIPTHNSAPYIGATIESVLTQTLDDLELIVVDDCSTDGTMDVVRGYEDRRLRLFVNDQNLGAVPNWNRTVRLATGRFIKVLCGDDLLYPTCLERQVDALERYGASGVVMASCRRDIIDKHGRVLIGGRGLPGMRGIVTGSSAVRGAVRSGTNPFGEPAAVLVSAQALAGCGPFAAHLPYVLDLEMWCRVLGHGDLYAGDETLCAFRVSESSWSRRLARQQSADVRALFQELRVRHPGSVTPTDELIGAMRAIIMGWGRRVGYAVGTDRWPMRPRPSSRLNVATMDCEPASPAGGASPRPSGP